MEGRNIIEMWMPDGYKEDKPNISGSFRGSGLCALVMLIAVCCCGVVDGIA